MELSSPLLYIFVIGVVYSLFYILCYFLLANHMLLNKISYPRDTNMVAAVCLSFAGAVIDFEF